MSNSKLLLTALELAVKELYYKEGENFVVNVSFEEYREYMLERLLTKAKTVCAKEDAKRETEEKEKVL